MQNGFYGFPRRTPKVAAGGLPPDGNYTDVSVSSSGTVWTINNNAVTFAKMQDIDTQKVIGRGTAGTGDPEQIGLDSTLAISAGNLGVQNDTSRQLTRVRLDGVDVGTRANMNYINSTATGLTWSIGDDGVNSEIEISFNSGSWSVVGNLTLDNIALSTTSYWGIIGGQLTDNTTESNRIVYWPYKATWRHLYIRTFGSQSATGSLVLTLRVNSVDTAITVTIAAGSASGSFSDTSNTATSAQGDAISLKAVNNATANSATCAWTIANRASA